MIVSFRNLFYCMHLSQLPIVQNMFCVDITCELQKNWK